MKNNISEQNKSTIDDISYMEITSNVPYNTHSQVEIFYVVKGNVSITVNGATKTLHKNQICFCDRFVSHSYNLLDSSTKCIVLVVPDYYTSN